MKFWTKFVILDGRKMNFGRRIRCVILFSLILAVMVVWRSGNALCRINEVALRRARLVLGWVTVYGQVNHLSTKPAS